MFKYFICMLIISSCTAAKQRRVPFDRSQIDDFSNTQLDDNAPIWPNAFQISFDTTIALFQNIGSKSMLYYDYNQKAQRIDFSECSDGSNVPCSYIFNATGAFLVKSNDSCCQAATVGVLSPQWPTILVANGTAPIYNIPANLWNGGSPTHLYYVKPGPSASGYQEPVALLVTDIYELWIFTQPFNLGTQDPKLFVIPHDCNLPC